jgi:hypothetical protein
MRSAAITGPTGPYTLTSSDDGKVVMIDSASATNVTIDTNVGSIVGFTCSVIQKGDGQITFVASGVTINSYESGTKTGGKHAAAAILCYDTNVFNLAGNITA